MPKTRSGRTPVTTPTRTPPSRQAPATGGAATGGAAAGGAATGGAATGGAAAVEIHDTDDEDLTGSGTAELPYWKVLINSETLTVINEVVHDEPQLRSFARHFWNFAFFIKRHWPPADMTYINEMTIPNIRLADRQAFKALWDEAFFETEEAFIGVVNEFAEKWLLTPMGVEYISTIEDHRYV